MADREKVIRGLELCAYDPDPGQELKEIRSCPECPYYRAGCSPQLIRDALELLRRQEPRVLTLEEVINAKDQTDVLLDELDCVVVAATISNWTSRVGRTNKSDKTYFYGIEHTGNVEKNYLHYNYNKTWRCWTSRPSPEQMRDTKWEVTDNG